MRVSQEKFAASKFPLRIMPSVRRVAEDFSQREGVSLNQFINIALAEKLAHLQHEEWLARRPKITDALTKRALGILDRPSGHPPEAFDKIPVGYRRAGRRIAAKRRAGPQKGQTASAV
jgi:hypothetical protein